MNTFEVLRRPVITEKGTMLGGLNKYAFEVAGDANKMQIKAAVELAFKVNVTSVRTMWTQPKLKRFGKSSGMTKPWKKAIVTLVEGQRIDLFPGV